LEYLDQVGLADQAKIEIIPTDRAAMSIFNPQEGSAGLALTSVYPILTSNGDVLGVVISVFLFNNNFNLVDHIKEVAGIDTVTIFFGDLRISTNVLNRDGSRAVGTRLSEEVYDDVLVDGNSYQGRAFVVNEWYITRYAPLHDHQGQVVGSLYVGGRVSTFQSLLRSFNLQVVIIAFVSIMLAGVIAIPVAKMIKKPIDDLVEANRRLARGNMSIQLPDYGDGEMGMLGRSFNRMVKKLNATQKELLHKEKLASMGQLAAGVAHEINNPLGTILLYADVMYKETPDDNPNRSDLRMIIDETTRCKNIVSGLLNFSRQQEIIAQETDLHQLIERTIEALSKQPAFDNIAIQCDFNSDLPTIQADPAQLQQVFTNLLENAAQSIVEDGDIRVTASKQDEQFVEVQVSDTGAGIPKENIGKLFSPFFTTKGLGKGTGLGLSIAYGIIKMHRGQISVQSEVGFGTTITVVLPIKPPFQRVSHSDYIG